MALVGPTPGELLRLVRLRNGLPQRALDPTGQPAISRIESGRVSPTVETLVRVLELAGADLRLTVQFNDEALQDALDRLDISRRSGAAARAERYEERREQRARQRN